MKESKIVLKVLLKMAPNSSLVTESRSSNNNLKNRNVSEGKFNLSIIKIAKWSVKMCLYYGQNKIWEKMEKSIKKFF